MDTADKVVLIVVSTLLAALIALLVLVVLMVDEELFTEAPDGCYVLTEKELHLFAEDKTTITTLCPVK